MTIDPTKVTQSLADLETRRAEVLDAISGELLLALRRWRDAAGWAAVYVHLDDTPAARRLEGRLLRAMRRELARKLDPYLTASVMFPCRGPKKRKRTRCAKK